MKKCSELRDCTAKGKVSKEIKHYRIEKIKTKIKTKTKKRENSPQEEKYESGVEYRMEKRNHTIEN